MPCKIVLKGESGSLSLGSGFPVRVNCNIGANNVGQLAFERERLRAVKDSAQLPDTFMDLSIGQYAEPLYKDIIRDFGCPVGTVPAYLFPSNEVVTKEYAINTLKRLADDGLSFFTLHLTADNETFEIGNNPCGVCINPKSSEEVHDAVMSLLDDSKQKEEYANRAKSRVQSMYSMPVVWKELVGIWTSFK